MIVYERPTDCQHTSDMHTHALMFLRLCMLGGWKLSDVKTMVSHEILFGMLTHKSRLWGRHQCTLFFLAIIGPPGPCMPPGLTQAQPPLPPSYVKPQGGLNGTSSHLDSSYIQHLIVYATATQTTNFTGE